VPIGDYGLIGDTRSAALVAPDGSIDWWCVPRFDDPPLFGRLVGGDEAGSFTLGPGEDARLTGRAYRHDTVTLTTTWAVDGGELELADGLVAEVEGRFLPGTVLVRRMSARGRAVRARIHLAPRFGYDRQPARRISRRGGALVCERGARHRRDLRWSYR
jgi:GH15 family glucan-1,4-alpha-glucosidase